MSSVIVNNPWLMPDGSTETESYLKQNFVHAEGVDRLYKVVKFGTMSTISTPDLYPVIIDRMFSFCRATTDQQY